jgi:hypothetical protein
VTGPVALPGTSATSLLTGLAPAILPERSLIPSATSKLRVAQDGQRHLSLLEQRELSLFIYFGQPVFSLGGFCAVKIGFNLVLSM